jgi:DNA polymerase III alpha subunit
MSLKDVKYINLHAHSDYSLQDGVGEPLEHFLETARKGHTGCCITDHGSYAAPFELYNIKLSEKKNKDVQEVYKECGISEHGIVPGVELYVYDDTTKIIFENILTDWEINGIEDSLRKLQDALILASIDERFTSLFDLESTKDNQDVMSDVKKKETSRTGEKLLLDLGKIIDQDQRQSLGEKKFEILIGKIKGATSDFAIASSRCKSYKYNHITLIAKNETGHRNICRMVSESHLPSNFYVRPRISLSELLKNKEGVIATTGCFIGMIPQAIHRKTGYDRELVELFLKEFGDDFYVEIHLGDLSWEWVSARRTHVKGESNPQEAVNLRLLELVKEFKLEGNTYITQDSHMPKKEDKEHQDLMILSDGSNSNGWHFKDAYYIMTVEEMWEKCTEFHSYIGIEDFTLYCENTQKVQEKCKNFSIDKSPKLVDFNPDDHHSTNPKRIRKDLFIEGEKKRAYGRSIESLVKESRKSQILDSELDVVETEKARQEIEQANKKINDMLLKYTDEYFLQKVLREIKGDPKLSAMIRTCILKKKINFDVKVLRDRFFFEVNTVQLNGYQPLADYFMMVEELPYITRELGEVPGLGRGSAPGSFMCYALDITNVDSVRMNLSFTRFLRKERIGTINIDFKFLAFSEWFAKKFPNNEGDFTVELLDMRERLLEIFTGVVNSLSLEISPDLKRELDYVYHNPEICEYLLYLLETTKGQIIENTCNSKIANIIGLATLPMGKVSEDKGSMPDIDFDSSCRDDICEFMTQKHGKKRAILIGTYGSLQIKSALKEILRIKPAFNEFGNKEILSPGEMNKATQLFDRVKFSEEEKEKGSVWQFEECLTRSKDIKNFFDINPDIFEYTKKVLGTKKSWGIHAAGIVMSEVDITSWIPCFYSAEKDAYISQLDMYLIESFGFVKMDDLGLTALEIARDAMYMIKENHEVDLFNRLEEIAFNEDPKVLANFSPKADTLGIPQFGPPVPTAYLRRVKNPIAFSFLPMTTAELRPGPMGMGVPEEVLKVINGVSPITYLHPLLEGILEKTYGHVVYQEQVINICILLGLTPFEADTVRRAMGKKKFDLIQVFKVKFLDGAMKKGITKTNAEEIWDVLAKFAEYGFNESHAVAYAGLSVIMMYLKTYYLNEFIAASLSTFAKKDTPSNKENNKKFHRTYRDIIVTPDVQTSQLDYTIKNGKVTMPIFSISRIGETVSRDIYKLAPFKSFTDMILKFKAHECESKSVVENLILSGACDSFRPSFLNIKKILKNEMLREYHEDERVYFLTNLLEIISYKPDEMSAKIVCSISYNLSEIGILPNESELDELFDTRAFKRGVSVFEFRKFLLSRYYKDLYHRKIHKKITDAIELELSGHINKDDLTAKIRFEILYADNQNKDIASLSNQLSKEVPETSGLLSSVKKLVSRGTESNLNKVSENLDTFEKWTVQEVIIKELELLKTTTYDFSSLVDNNAFISECTPISKLKMGLDNIRSKLEICMGSLDELKGLLLRYQISVNETIGCTIDIFNIMSEVLTPYSSKKVFGKFLKGLLNDIRIPLDVKNEIVCRLGFALNDKAAKTIPKDIRRKITMKGMIGKKYLTSFKNVTRSDDSDFVRESEFNLCLNLSIDEEFRFHLFTYIINNGKAGLQKIQKKYPNCLEIENIGKAIVDLKITPDSLKEWRAVITMFDFNNPMDTVLSDDPNKNTDEGEEGISKMLLRLQAFEFSNDEVKVMNSKIFVCGAIFRPEKKKDFKRDYLSNGKIKNRLTFSIAENGDDVIDMAVFDSDSYQDIYVGNETLKFEDLLKDYSMVKMRIKVQFNDELSDYKFSVDSGANAVLPIKFNSVLKQNAS